MITIEQLLESVDLGFEPGWITKDEPGTICIWDEHRPVIDDDIWSWNKLDDCNCAYFGSIKLSEFDGKDWTECIYEVPRKTTGKIYKFDSNAVDTLYDSNPEKFKNFICGEFVCKLNEVIDAVNELKGGL